MPEVTALLNGKIVPHEDLRIHTDDLGFLQGVTVSERLRTFDGNIFRWQDHVDRLDASLRVLNLDWPVPIADFETAVNDLVARHVCQLDPTDDVGISIFVTPGRLSDQRPTWGVEVYQLPFAQWADWYPHGQALAETPIRQVPANCWPSALKCRSRMHYYLADQQADRLYSGARAVLLDQDGFVTELSTANIVVYNDKDGLRSPSLEKILPGVSLAVVMEIAADLGIPYSYADLGIEDLAQAREVLLCSTSPCLWAATRLNGQPIADGRPGPVWSRLIEAWSQQVGLDIVAQAQQHAR